MGMVDMFLTAQVRQKMAQAVKAGEALRRASVRRVLDQLAQDVRSGKSVDQAVAQRLDEAMVAGQQAKTLRDMASQVGNALAAEILGKVADALEGR